MGGYLVEEEAGTCSGRFPAHNGYYAGDFGVADLSSAGRVPLTAWVRTKAHPAETGRR